MSLDPKIYKEEYTRAQALYEQGDVTDAAEIVKELLRHEQYDAELWGLEAELRMETEDFEAAEYAVKQACQLAPDTFFPYLLQAHLCNELGQFEEAEIAAQKAGELAQTVEEECSAYLEQANAIFVWGQDKILISAEEVADEEGYMPDTMQIPSDIEKKLKFGFELTQNAIALDETRAGSWELHANYLEFFNDLEEALNAWTKARELDPENLDFLHSIGRCLEDLESMDEAKAAYAELQAAEAEIFEDDDDLIFPPEEFAKVANEAWAEVEHNEIEEGTPFIFDFQVALYPSAEMMEELEDDSVLDPRVGLNVEFIPNLPHDPIIKLVLFQRNIERDFEDVDSNELYHTLEELFADYVDQMASYMDQGAEEDF